MVKQKEAWHRQSVDHKTPQVHSSPAGSNGRFSGRVCRSSFQKCVFPCVSPDQQKKKKVFLPHCWCVFSCVPHKTANGWRSVGGRWCFVLLSLFCFFGRWKWLSKVVFFSGSCVSFFAQGLRNIWVVFENARPWHLGTCLSTAALAARKHL